MSAGIAKSSVTFKNLKETGVLVPPHLTLLFLSCLCRTQFMEWPSQTYLVLTLIESALPDMVPLLEQINTSPGIHTWYAGPFLIPWFWGPLEAICFQEAKPAIYIHSFTPLKYYFLKPLSPFNLKQSLSSVSSTKITLILYIGEVILIEPSKQEVASALAFITHIQMNRCEININKI